MIASACLLLLGLCQEPDANPPAPTPAPIPAGDELIRQFRALSADQRDAVARALSRRLQTEPWEVLQRIAGKQRGSAAYPPLAARQFFDPAVYAPVAPKRQVLTPGTPLHDGVTAAFPEPPFLDDLQTAVVYDWSAGCAAKVQDQLPDEALFANVAHGYAPGSDHVVAQIQALLDTDPRQRELAKFLEHTYADRDGRVFAGVSLYRAFYAGKTVEMPDVDAIAFARDIVKTDAFVSPIPAGRRRERLYRQMLDAFAEHRQYRTLRQAVAAAFVAAKPPIDATYSPLLNRAHYLWTICDWSPKALLPYLQGDDRAEVLERIDRLVKQDPVSQDRIDAAQKQLEELSAWLRSCAHYELQRAQQH